MVIVEDLCELNVGDLDGRSDGEAWAIHDQVLADWQAGRYGSAFPGGEDYHQAAMRATASTPSRLRLVDVDQELRAFGGHDRAAS